MQIKIVSSGIRAVWIVPSCTFENNAHSKTITQSRFSIRLTIRNGPDTMSKLFIKGGFCIDLHPPSSNMFSSKSYLERKTGPYGVGRQSYLQSLVNEYQNTDSSDAKTQIMANLANFAYDPINYEHFITLNILDLFLDGLEEMDEDIVEYAIGGICNACTANENRQHIIDNGGIQLVISCLSKHSENTVLSAITSLIYLVTPETKQEITSVPVVECMLRLSNSKNVKLKNMASLFLQDYCSQSVIQEAVNIQKTHCHMSS